MIHSRTLTFNQSARVRRRYSDEGLLGRSIVSLFRLQASLSRASVSGSAVVAALVLVAPRRNAQAPRTARHHRRPSGRGRQSRFAGRRRDAMREHLLQFYACAHARWLKAPYYDWLFLFFKLHIMSSEYSGRGEIH